MTFSADFRSQNLQKSAVHPCFNSCGGKNARIHLPVAENCNIQCNYCRRKFSCVNESRPGVTSAVLTPHEAQERCLKALEKIENLSVVGIAGPGDALACPDNTFETLRLVRDVWKEAIFCLSTNGLLLPEYADSLAECGVSHITVTINSLKPETARKIYRYADYHGRRLTGRAASDQLIENQIEGLRRASALGIVCKVNTVFINGLNDSEIPQIAAAVKDAGADLMNIMQLIPVPHTLFEDIPLVRNEYINEMRTKCESILPQMRHCKQCRADAVGTLDNDLSLEFTECFTEKTKSLAAKDASGTNKNSGQVLVFAVASKNGVLVDEHFGHISEFLIYEWCNGGILFKEKRPVSQFCGGGNCSAHERLPQIYDVLKDCAAILVLRIGEVPRAFLAERGIKVIMTYDYVETAVKEAAENLINR
ncbi:MAG: hypothetical protein Ta2F_00380 [Termitinemataceae bacterium]|nr:MAG: hypothetical protein Ta2F_00380 [Termitinemataceae bacterium]